jgi:hypothetical protein
LEIIEINNFVNSGEDLVVKEQSNKEILQIKMRLCNIKAKDQSIKYIRSTKDFIEKMPISSIRVMNPKQRYSIAFNH